MSYFWGEREIIGEKSCAQLFSPIISSTMPKKKTVNNNRKGETIARWGSPERRRFAQLVADGTIDLEANPTSKVIDPLRKWFGNRSVKSFRTQYKTCLAKHRVERDKAGGRKRGKFSLYLLFNPIAILLTGDPAHSCSWRGRQLRRPRRQRRHHHLPERRRRRRRRFHHASQEAILQAARRCKKKGR